MVAIKWKKERKLVPSVLNFQEKSKERKLLQYSEKRDQNERNGWAEQKTISAVSKRQRVMCPTEANYIPWAYACSHVREGQDPKTATDFGVAGMVGKGGRRWGSIQPA